MSPHTTEVPAETTASIDLVKQVPDQLLIGSWTGARGGKTFEVKNPADGSTLKTIADGSPDDAAAALDAAAAAAESWGETSPRERSELLLRLYDAVIARRQDFAVLITLEMGKPLAEAQAEVDYGADYIRWYAEEANRIHGRNTLSPDGKTSIVTSKEPVGPCLLITPWNFPLAMATRKIAPALAAGCTVVLKPAALTPLTSLLLARVAVEIGIPEGVINVITTTDSSGLSSRLMEDSRLRKVSFTGSTAVGRRLMAQASGQLLRTSMELGGNAPLIIFEGANITTAVSGAVAAKLRNGGQSCVASNRILVQDTIADEFARLFSEALATIKVGNGLDKHIGLGPLIDTNAVHKCQELVDDAIAKGAALLTGGSPLTEAGPCFYPPTVLDHVPLEARIMHEEVFGPVAPIHRFGSEDEAVQIANATEYGLASYVFSQDLEQVNRVIARIQAGMVGVNRGIISNVAAPFGGIKHSGLGREGGPEGIDEYLNTKYVALNR